MEKSSDMPDDPDDDGDDEREEDEDGPDTTRDTELSTIEEYQEDLRKMAEMVEQGFRHQIYRTEEQFDYWDIWECVLNDQQAYNGNAQAYISLAADAIDARKTRFTNQLFPTNGRYVEVISQDGTIPHAEMALLEHYIDKAKLRTEIVPATCINGDVEGQYNLYVGWRSTERYVVSKKSEAGEDGVMTDVISEEVILDEGPYAETIPDADIIILPATSDSIEAALENGGVVAITRRWSKAKIEAMIDAKEITEEAGESLLGAMKNMQTMQTDVKKEHVSATGIKAKGDWFLGREAWHKIEVDGKQRIVKSLFGANDHQLLSTKLNPNWNDRVPVISAPVKKVSGSMKGGSLLKRVSQLQYLANDFLNQAADSATYGMMPIVMTDPNSNPKSSTMILDLAAVWEVDPSKTQFAKFPELWKGGFELISALKGQIQQSLGVNPSMIPATSGKSKRSQADIANEQAVDILTTADSVTVIEQGVLTPLVRWFVDLDMQYRHDDLLIPMFGMMGKTAKMERIPPLQQGNRYDFNWSGVQAARNAAQVQQMIGWINVVKGIPPQMYRDHRIDLTAAIEYGFEVTMGPRLAPRTFISVKDELSIPQDEENKYLEQGIYVPVSPMDDDADHLKKLQPVLQNDPTGFARQHAQDHQTQMQQKAMAAMQQQMAQMQGGQGGGPREGAMPGQPRPQGPPGMVHPDQMTSKGGGVVNLPRKM